MPQKHEVIARLVAATFNLHVWSLWNPATDAIQSQVWRPHTETTTQFINVTNDVIPILSIVYHAKYSVASVPYYRNTDFYCIPGSAWHLTTLGYLNKSLKRHSTLQSY